MGVGVSVGAQTGVYVYGEVGGSKGKNHYLAQTHDHTALKAGNIRLASKGDTTLKGATATAHRIDADVKGRLNIESVQDHIEQENQQTGAGVRVQVSFGTAWEASGNFSQSKASGSSDTVSTQSGLFAGDGGYHIKADSVHLKGGAIASAAPKEQNELTANRLTFENIQNQSSYQATNIGLSGGYGENPDKEPGYTDGSNFSPSLPQYEKGGDNSTTYATLSEGRLNIAGKDTTVQELGIHSDSSSAHRAVAALPDLAKITEKQQIVAKATADVASAVSTYRQNQLAKAQEALSNAETDLMGATFSGNQSDIEAAQGRLNEARENVKAWETGGSKARALNAGTTLITGILGGQSEVQAAVNTASPYTAQLIGQTFGQNGSHPNEALQLLAHAVNSGVLATVNGGSFEAGAVSGAGSELAAKAITQTLFGKEAAANPNALGEQEKTLVSDLSAVFGTVSGGLAGGSALNAQIGAVAGQNAVENNYLSLKDVNDLRAELKRAKTDKEKERIIEKYRKKGEIKSKALKESCRGKGDECHLNAIAELRNTNQAAATIVNNGLLLSLTESGRTDLSAWGLALDSNLPDLSYHEGQLSGGAKLLDTGVKLSPVVGAAATAGGSKAAQALAGKKTPTVTGGRQPSVVDGEYINNPTTTLPARIGATSKGASIEYVPQGTLLNAQQDFAAFKPTNIKTTSDGKVLMGNLSNGNTIKLRPSNDGGRNRWTIEIIRPNGRTLREIRYGNQ